MSHAGTIPTDDELIASADAGMLLDLLETEVDHDSPDSLLNRAAALHNAGRFDLLGEKSFAAIDRLAGRDFFNAQQLMGDLIPKLTAPLADMMAMVKYLVQKGGADGFAGFPLQAFKAWLSKDHTRAENILESFRVGTSEDAGYLAAALEVRGDPTLVFPFLAFDDSRRQFATSALGAIQPADDATAAVALAKILPLAQADPHDMTRFTAIFTAWEILKHVPHLAPIWTPLFVAAVQANPTNQTVEAMLQGLWRRTNLFDDQAVTDSLDIAMAADLSNERLRNLLVIVLGHLIKPPHDAKALAHLTTLLGQGLIDMGKNGSILHRFHAMGQQQVFDLVVRWLGTGNPMLCEAAVAITVKAGQGAPFVADLSAAGLSSDEIVALAYRAVGWFFIHPTTAASVIVAGLRLKDAKATPILTKLLYFPLLLNYLGSVQDYLKTIKRGDAAWAPARKALKQAADYVKGLETKGPIKELLPSDYQVSISRERRMEMNRDMHKQVRKESVLLSLVHQSTILYGRSTMTYVRGADNPPMTMDMHAYSHSVEVPRLDVLDPVSLSWMLWRFRMARP